jgi:hypothetical protein
MTYLIRLLLTLLLGALLYQEVGLPLLSFIGEVAEAIEDGRQLTLEGRGR